MNPEAMGRVCMFLLAHRVVETKPAVRRPREGEREVAAVLKAADSEEIADLQTFLGAQGLALIVHDDTSMPGVPAGGRVWLLTRNARDNPPAFLSVDRIHQGLKIRASETNQTATIWFLHIWLNCLALLYTQPSRGISEVSRYQDAIFRKSTLEEAVKHHVEQVRRIGVVGGAVPLVVRTLIAEAGRDVHRRVGNFLTLMCDSGLLQSIGEDEYRQTLLGAVEIAQSFNHSLANLRPGDDVLDNIVNIADPRVSNADSRADF